MRIVVLGLSLSSSWGNGHATTYRALLRALARRGTRHSVPGTRQALVRRAPRSDRAADFCRLRFYDDLAGLQRGASRSPRPTPSSWAPTFPTASRDRARASDGARHHRVLRYRHAGYAGQACARGIGVSLRRDSIPELRSLSLVHRRPDPAAAGNGAMGRGRHERSTAPSIPTSTSPTGAATRWDLGYLGTYSADRQPALERLLIGPPARGPICASWWRARNIPADIAWPDNVERIEHLPPAEHARFLFRPSLDAQRHPRRHGRGRLQPERASVRGRRLRAPPSFPTHGRAGGTFSAPAARWPWCAREADVLAMLDRPERERLAIAKAARRRVLAEHTAAHRARELEGHIREAAARRSGLAAQRVATVAA